MIRHYALLILVVLAVGCVSTVETPTAAPLPTLPSATGIPVTPKQEQTSAFQAAAPTGTVETLPTPQNTAELFRPAGDVLKNYQPPQTDPKPLYDALANGITQFLSGTANPDVSLEGQPALKQLQDALGQIPNLPQNAQAQVTAIHLGDDQGGSRDVVFVAMRGVMGLPILGIERLGPTYDGLAPISFQPTASPDDRYFYPASLDIRDVTGDKIQELVYTFEYPGGSATSTDLTVARWDPDQNQLKPLFHAVLMDWAGESDYSIETAADASTIKLTFPWFGAFDHKLLAHPTATQTWEYDDKQDRFVRVSQTIEPAKTPREQLNAAEYTFRNGDLQGAVDLYQRAWSDTALQPEDFGESKADPAAFAKFRQAMVLGLLGRTADANKLLTDAQKSGNALAQIVSTYVKANSGKDGALRGWIAMANAGDLYQLIYESKAGNLDFPFEAREVYLEGGIVASYLNTHGGADKNPAALWQALSALGFKPLFHASADLDGDGANEFLFVTEQGGSTPNQARDLWFVYKRENAWRVRNLDIADVQQIEADTVALPTGNGRAFKIKQPDAVVPSESALTWDGSRVIWLDATTLQPRPISNGWPVVGGGVLEDDF